MAVYGLNKCDIIEGDCRTVLATYPENTFDSVVTDSPYGINFLGKGWDHGVPDVNFWKEILRVSKPGAHMLAFGGPRTHHRLMVAIEDAGWELKDTLVYCYGSGFPKSLNISKKLDHDAGAKREVIAISNYGSGAQPNKLTNHGKGDTGIGYADGSGKQFTITAPSTENAKKWDGWQSSLKPAWEPIILARKPVEGSIAKNILKWGVGGLNIDGCRVPINPKVDDMLRMTVRKVRETKTWEDGSGFKNESNHVTGVPANGRYPANFVITYPENEYILRDDVTPDQLLKLGRWLNENP